MKEKAGPVTDGFPRQETRRDTEREGSDVFMTFIFFWGGGCLFVFLSWRQDSEKMLVGSTGEFLLPQAG